MLALGMGIQKLSGIVPVKQQAHFWAKPTRVHMGVQGWMGQRHDGQRRDRSIQYMGNGDIWPKKQGEGKGGKATHFNVIQTILNNSLMKQVVL